MFYVSGRPMTLPWLPALGLVVLCAQTPAPAGSSAPETKPLRHLEYAFTVHREGLGGAEFNGNYELAEFNGAGLTGDGGSGTMSVDVLSIAPDGALVARISEWVKGDLRAREAYTCMVYGNTTVLCPSVPAPSQAQWVLLSYLGRQFVDGSPWDAQQHWKHTKNTGRYDLVEDFSLLPGSDDKRALIREAKVVSVHNGGYSKQREDVMITYDRAMELPDTIHDDFTVAGDSGEDTGHATFDFQLRDDSFAKQ